jgi:uncharacterized protein YceK
MNMNKIITLLLSLMVVISLSGCNNVSSSEVIADSVSSYEYDSMSCSSIEAEISYLQKAASEASGVVDKKKSSQQGKGAAAVLLFWPALFIIDDNSLEAQKYARLKGEYEAALKAHRKKDC